MRSIIFIALALASMSAHAYIGPGLGLGTLGALLGGLLAVVLAVVGLVWYPMKRMIRKMRGAPAPSDPQKKPPEESEEQPAEQLKQSDEA